MRVVVIGGDAAGMSAASQISRLAPEAEVTVFEKTGFVSYSACGIPYWVAGTIKERSSLIARTPEQFRKAGIDVQLESEVTAIDPEGSTVTLADGSTHAWDRLLIATGAQPVRPPIEGIDLEGIHGIQTLDDGCRLLDDIERGKPKRAVVVGAGYIGLEMAEAFIERGIPCAVVDIAEQPMSTLDSDMAAIVADALVDHGVELHLGEGVERFESTNGRVGRVVTDKHSFDTDIVVLGLGVQPRKELAEGAGLECDRGIRVDPRMQTSHPRIWAAGDCVEVWNRISNRFMPIALGTHANKQGRVAGTNIAGSQATFDGAVGTAITKLCGLEVARTGVTEKEATDAGLDFGTVTVEGTVAAGYWPDDSEQTTKILYEKSTGRLLGAQICGTRGSGKRIDVFATALWNSMTVQEMQKMDLSYAPPFSAVWDSPLITTRKAAEQMEGGQ